MTERAPTLLRMNDAVLGYPGTAVLKEVNVELHHGDFIPLVGVNGSGKSTLLKTVAGILKPLSGLVELGKNGGPPPRVGYIPQSEKLDPIFPLSTLDVVQMGAYGFLKPGQWMGKEYRDLARECLEKTESQHLAEIPFSVLSGGQKQRVLLSRALAPRPELLILDEPTSGIDVAGERRFIELILRINQTEKVAVLLATHNQKIVRIVASDVLWLHDGRTERVDVETAFQGEVQL